MDAFGNRQAVGLEFLGLVLDGATAHRGEDVVRAQGEGLPLGIVAQGAGDVVNAALEGVGVFVGQGFAARPFQRVDAAQVGEAHVLVVGQAQRGFLGLVEGVVDAQLVGLLLHVEGYLPDLLAACRHRAAHLLRLLPGHVGHFGHGQACLR